MRTRRHDLPMSRIIAGPASTLRARTWARTATRSYDPARRLDVISHSLRRRCIPAGILSACMRSGRHAAPPFTWRPGKLSVLRLQIPHPSRSAKREPGRQRIEVSSGRTRPAADRHRAASRRPGLDQADCHDLASLTAGVDDRHGDLWWPASLGGQIGDGACAPGALTCSWRRARTEARWTRSPGLGPLAEAAIDASIADPRPYARASPPPSLDTPGADSRRTEADRPFSQPSPTSTAASLGAVEPTASAAGLDVSGSAPNSTGSRPGRSAAIAAHALARHRRRELARPGDA